MLDRPALKILKPAVERIVRLVLLWASNQFVYRLGHDLSLDLYAKTLNRPYSFHISHNTSEIIGGLGKTMSVVGGFINPLLSGVVAIILSLGIVSILVYLNPFVALIGASSFVISYIVLALLVRHRMKRNGAVIARSQDQRLQEVQEGLGGIRDVILDSAQSVYVQRYRLLDNGFMQALGSNGFLSVAPRYAVEGVGLMIIAGFAMHASQRAGGVGDLLPLLAALGLGAQKLLPLIQQIYNNWSSLVGNQAILQDVLALLDAPLPDAHDEPQSLPFTQAIRLHGVHFSYASAPERTVLAGVDLSINKGSSLGIVGETGSGKSTLVDLLMGLLLPTEGAIEIDDQQVTVKNLPVWRKHISHVPQVIYLSDASIAENIAFGCRKRDIDWPRLYEAAKAAQIADHITGLPDGYNTLVGERGVRLSGGQRQRIGIARALYRRCSVLVLDEATSALDSDTEKRVMEGINSYAAELTTIIIAHRISTLERCDQIVTINQGKLAAQHQTSKPLTQLIR